MLARFRPSPTLMRLLTPGLHVKRWLLLLMVGIVMIALAVGYALRDVYSANFHFPSFVQDITLQFLPRWTRAVLFLGVGIVIIGFSFYFLGKSVLGPFLTRGEKGLIQQLYAFRQLAKGPRVVAIGGGTGLSTLLRGLKKYTGNISAIVTVADDGGSSGRLRSEFRVLPPGDFRQCLTALAETEPLMTELFQHRFSGDGALGGHSFGNLFIMAMAEITGDFEHAIRESGRVLAVRGAIVPSTLTDVVLCANAGSELRVGESKVPIGDGRIDRVFLEPSAPPINPEAENAVLEAEIVIVGPGSLYTSILPNLLVDGMVEALRASPAVKVYVCNVAGQVGETMGFTVSEHLEAIRAHVGGDLFDYVIVNSNLTPPLPASARRIGINRVVFDRQRAQQHPVHYILADVVSTSISSHHDSDKLARVVMKRVWR
ncbi:MAG TPA: gluconeogenesis factor YvcK family protein [Candidatus Binatia bacterium]|nr:gluconeogenesis factor YvcK family protein [Candidatus Binatia bacterium]